MKKQVAVVLLCCLSSWSCASDKVELKTDSDKASYAVGLKYGEGIKKELNDLSLPLFIRGVQDGYAQKGQLLSTEEVAQVIGAYQQKKIAELQQTQGKLAAENKKKGEAFLAANKKKKGVITTASGLQYRVIKQGTGKTPALDSKVKVHYHGTLVNGTVFDSSVQRGEPVTFPVNGVIPGWTEALQLMKVGSKWQVVIPSQLAYGERGAGSAIGPNSVLIFDVELLSIEQ